MPSLRCQRSQASCTMSSASAALPSMRYAIAKQRARCCSNSSVEDSARMRLLDERRDRGQHADHALGVSLFLGTDGVVEAGAEVLPRDRGRQLDHGRDAELGLELAQ